MSINIYTMDIIAVSFIFLIVAIALAYMLYKEYKINLNMEKNVLITILMSGLLIRLILAPITKGHSTDVLCFTYWADFAATKGLSNFYTSGIFVDYPPGYIYVLYVIGKLQHLLGVAINSKLMLFMIKVPSITADIFLSYLIYKLGKNRLNGTAGIILCALYIFNPAVIINSAVWAQIDGFYTLFIVIMMYFIYKEKLEISAILYTLAILIKPQTLIFTPILLFFVIKDKGLKSKFKAIIYAIITAVIIIVPFTGSQNLLWIITKYKTTLSSYAYASINAFNLFALNGGNWQPDNYSFMFLNYRAWGNIFIILITVFSTYIYFISKERHKVFYISYFIISSVFVLSSKMHERYLFPALALALILYIYSKERKILYTFIGLSISHYINVAYVLMWNGKDINFIPNGSPWIKVSATANIVLLLLIIKIGLDMYCKKSLIPDICRICGIAKKDFYSICFLTAVYFVIAIINLGSVKVPESYWSPSVSNENVIADLGEVKEVDRLYYFSGLGGGQYKIYYSIDKSNWQESMNFSGDNLFAWNYAQVSVRARYFMISCVEPGGTLYEVGIFQKGSNVPISIRDEMSSKLFDEQFTVRYSPSYLHGMYFDEIYHARTAFEHLKRMEPYEWTHPPLGKIFISMGIFLFGMNPFGWRIVGTLIGVIMIPLMYMLALNIFKKARYAFTAAFLLTFDFMHFTQTRIATIDVYATFFIMLMYYFIYKFINGDFYDKHHNSFKYLMLSGIAFGLGAASKWSCIYGGVGLAVILFIYLIGRYREYRLACKILSKDNIDNAETNEEYREIKEFFKGNVMKVIIYGIVFFIVVPVVIYILSYIPYMLVHGSKGLADVFAYQKRMYDYHSNLVATHPFSSFWWEWPILRKPIWYYTGQIYLPADKVSSIVSMGNPAIWWTGIITIVSTAVISIKEKDKRGLFIILSAVSQYVPWVFVPRLTFIYHYFATVPFIMLSIVYTIEWITIRYKNAWKYVNAYLFIVLVLFFMFYPIMAGFTVDKAYISKFLRWFGTWYFYS